MKPLAILFCAAALVGCNKTETTQQTPSASAPVASASTTAATELPSEEDFEDEAEKDITPDTLEAQLAALEKEVDTP
jgi:hypothetical protein